MNEIPVWPEYDYEPDAVQQEGLPAGNTCGVLARTRLPEDALELSTTIFLPHSHGLSKYTSRRDAHHLIVAGVDAARKCASQGTSRRSP